MDVKTLTTAFLICITEYLTFLYSFVLKIKQIYLLHLAIIIFPHEISISFHKSIVFPPIHFLGRRPERIYLSVTVKPRFRFRVTCFILQKIGGILKKSMTSCKAIFKCSGMRLRPCYFVGRILERYGFDAS